MWLIWNLLLNTCSFIIGYVSYDDYIGLVLLNLTQSNVLFIKLFQSLSANKSVSPRLLTLFRKNTNSSEYYQSDIDYILIEQIREKYDIVIENLVPINSGMIAIVFKGHTKEGKELVIKIKRKDITKRLERGYKQFVFWYHVAKVITYPFQANDFLESIASFIESKDYIMTQCDFNNEIEVMRTTKEEVSDFSENNTISDLDKIIIPDVYNLEGDDEFIIMDYLSGKTCFEVDNNQKQQYVRLLLKFALCSNYLFRYMHTDLHPGNLICMNDEGTLKLGIIDFGMFLKIGDSNVKMALSRVSDILLNSNDKHKDFIFYVKDLLNPAPDISLYTSEQRIRLNIIIENLFTDLLKGRLTELTIRKYKSKIDTIVPGLSKNHFDVDVVKILLAFTMINSTILSLTGDTEFIYETQKKIIMEIYS
uniref:ABC1 atypical kinase-like domain-containing protein n=1 Tax=viral metagenome TaxID=1070528 RepID=A0A6C0E4A6_9ZZZZ